ncbi:uncharacterized protein LOC128989413 [Macrosteles quadrilineatus]|uniref:uncharacterized protein LOC128989413 n=1 Tax=Macrosteles quadrilineatus TaxID=74068 RepID=UPI0023E2FA85|nr:uncharacterized protein LOC128989413 [Macrosteles quadrilineatus]
MNISTRPSLNSQSPINISDFPPLQLKNKYASLAGKSGEGVDETLADTSLINSGERRRARRGSMRRRSESRTQTPKPKPLNDCSTPQPPSNLTLPPSHNSFDLNPSNTQTDNRNCTQASRPKPSPNTARRKILIVSDSHGKDLASYLTVLTQNKFNIFSLCRPGAKLVDVIDGLNKQVEGMCSEDTVIIIGGSNDIFQGLSSIISSKVRQRLKCLKNLNGPKVIMMKLPPRHDDPRLNWTIQECNKGLEANNVTKDFNFISVGNFNRRLFTNHGQHLNKSGKIYTYTKPETGQNSTFHSTDWQNSANHTRQIVSNFSTNYMNQQGPPHQKSSKIR